MFNAPLLKKIVVICVGLFWESFQRPASEAGTIVLAQRLGPDDWPTNTNNKRTHVFDLGAFETMLRPN